MSLRPPSLHLMTAISIARCLPLLLLFFLTTPSAMTPPNDIVLPPLNITDSVERHHVIRSATSLHQEISLPPESTVLIEAFYTSSHPYPRLLLLVGDTVPPLIPTSRDAPPGVTGDYEAFWTKRKYAYVIIANHTRLHIRLCESQDHFAVSLNATLRISLVPPDSCPRGPDNQTCSNKGSCRGGECLCAKGYAGRYCESRVANLTNDPFDIPSEDMVIHHYNVQRNGSVAVRLYAHHDPAHGPAGHPSLFVKLAYENGGDYLRNGPPLPTIYDAKFRGRPGMHGHLPVQTIVRTNLERNDKLYIGVYNDQKHLLYIPRNHVLPAGILASYAPVTARLEAFPCATRHVKGVRRCPATGHESWELSLTFLLLPLLLGTLTLLTMVVCVSVWAGVFRQQLFEVIHGHAPEEALSRRDKLSEAEVNAMFPAFVFTKGETAALGATGDVCCSVCLSSFEEGELLRRLACGHSYHSTCLDKWLLTNATCPRCRKSARIHGEVGRGWLIRRFIMTFVGRLHGALNWMVGYSQTRAREAPELESIEVEGLLPNRDDGVLRRYVQAS